MFLLVLAYPGCPGQTAIKWLLLLFSHFKTIHHYYGEDKQTAYKHRTATVTDNTYAGNRTENVTGAADVCISKQNP